MKKAWMSSYPEVTNYVLFLEGGMERMENHLVLSLILLLAKMSSPVSSKTYDKASVGKSMENLF
jgi:hypothetical protein